jgi:hypothetical protein
MRTITKITYTLLILSSLSACSPVDSLKPFDQEQATNIIKQSYTTQPAKQMISIVLPQPQHWKRLNQMPAMLIPANETKENWTESIQTNIGSCINDKKKDHITICRTLNGIDADYSIRYTAMTGKVSQPEINRMSSVIQNGRLIFHP